MSIISDGSNSVGYDYWGRQIKWDIMTDADFTEPEAKADMMHAVYTVPRGTAAIMHRGFFALRVRAVTTIGAIFAPQARVATMREDITVTALRVGRRFVKFERKL